MTFIIDGTAGATFPNGTNPQAAPSKVLQVVQGTYNLSSSTTGTSYVASGLTASITPLFSTSKILIITSSSITNSSAGSGGTNLTIYRNSTNLGGGTATALADYLVNSGTSSLWVPCSIIYLDSPTTTSSTTYTLYYSVSGAGTAYATINQTLSTITLMEIAQ